MAPNPADEASWGGVQGCVRPPSVGCGLRITDGLRIATGLGPRPDCRITDSSRTWEDLYQAR
eukprot:11606441-Alexandrium_andersonii.AAC.1